jgi:hypothetical protein
VPNQQYRDGLHGRRTRRVKRNSFAFEEIASNNFKVERALHAGMVRIFEKHLTEGRDRKNYSLEGVMFVAGALAAIRYAKIHAGMVWRQQISPPAH